MLHTTISHLPMLVIPVPAAGWGQQAGLAVFSGLSNTTSHEQSFSGIDRLFPIRQPDPMPRMDPRYSRKILLCAFCAPLCALCVEITKSEASTRQPVNPPNPSTHSIMTGDQMTGDQMTTASSQPACPTNPRPPSGTPLVQARRDRATPQHNHPTPTPRPPKSVPGTPPHA
jgi:hypothetical protein